MLINFVSYLNPSKFHGGGELVNKALIHKGEERGHKFLITSARNRISEFSIKADLDILIDVHNYPHTLKSRGASISLPKPLLSEIINNRPFVHMTNAYADICNLPYLPCSGNSRNTCVHKSNLNLVEKITNRDFVDSCFAIKPIVKEAFINSMMNIYVSPLHKDIVNKVLNFNDDIKSYVLKPLIDTRQFCARNIDRDIEYLFVGVISEAKGYYNLKQLPYREKIVFVGDIHPKINLDFGKYMGKLPYAEIPNLMNRAQNFVFLPRWPEPQGRVVVEAALMGCNLIVNENVGAITFPFDLADPNNYKDSADAFWDEIELLAS